MLGDEQRDNKCSEPENSDIRSVLHALVSLMWESSQLLHKEVFLSLL